MASQPHTLITAEQFYQLPQEEGREFELLDGEVIEIPSPTPRHNIVAHTLGSLLYPALQGRGRVIPETDFSDGRFTALRPDLSILLGEKYTHLHLDKVPVSVPPDIVVEVISPSESALRVERRIRAYLRFGVTEIWIAHPLEGTLYFHTETSVTRLRSGDTRSTPLLPGWSVSVNQLFES
jgi:Uma2 family endonuclease